MNQENEIQECIDMLPGVVQSIATTRALCDIFADVVENKKEAVMQYLLMVDLIMQVHSEAQSKLEKLLEEDKLNESYVIRGEIAAQVNFMHIINEAYQNVSLTEEDRSSFVFAKAEEYAAEGEATYQLAMFMKDLFDTMKNEDNSSEGHTLH